jgi:hypothetical protein
MQYDIKHAYWSLSVHPDDRHVFVSGMGQMQPTRMPQGSCSAGFSMAEVMNITLGPIPTLPLEYRTNDSDGSYPSLLISQEPSTNGDQGNRFGVHKSPREVLDAL